MHITVFQLCIKTNPVKKYGERGRGREGGRDERGGERERENGRETGREREREREQILQCYLFSQTCVEMSLKINKNLAEIMSKLPSLMSYERVCTY